MAEQPTREMLVGHRRERWRVDVLTNTEQLVGHLDTMRLTGTLDFSVHDTIRSAGFLDVDLPTVPDWTQVRLQPWYELETAAGSASWPMGVFIPATPKTRHTGAGSRVKVELYDKLQVLNEDAVETTWSYDAGRNVTAAVTEVIQSANETKIAVAESPLTLAAPMVWEAGTTKLRIVNDLLAAINYFSLWVDGHGVYRADPYVPPRDRGLAWEFIDDRESIYLPDFTHEADYFKVPNKVVAIQKTMGDAEPLLATATNENPDSPFSYQSRGRWITATEQDVEAADATVLGNIAARRLLELSQVTSTFEIEHAPIPLALNDAVYFRNQAATLSATAVVQKLSVSMDLGAQIRATLRQVV